MDALLGKVFPPLEPQQSARTSSFFKGVPDNSRAPFARKKENPIMSKILQDSFPRVLLILLCAVCGAASLRATTYDNQKAFIEKRFGMFIHFNMGTYHDMEWVLPGQDPKSFAPPSVDCVQWAAAAKSAGMKFAVLTTKHHDGFCLWPTKFTTYNVMSSAYPHDIVKMYVDAFRAQGITPCIYFSIWDRNQKIEPGSVSQADLDFIKGQLTELLTNYGDIPLLVTDGWMWKMGHREAAYQVIRETVKRLQPNCLIVDHNGMTEPYEEDLLNFEHFSVPSTNTYASTQGNSIMPRWFWHPGYPDLDPLNLNSLISRLKNCEAHYCNFLLNCPPNPNGKIDPNIVNRLAEAGKAWTPNLARAPLPAQPTPLEHPVTPVAATATSGTAANAIDGMSDWVSGAAVETLWQSAASLPQSVTLDLGSVWTPIDMLTYLPRFDHTGDVTSPFITTGNITGYNIYVSTDNKSFTKIASGTWAGDKTIKRVRFTPTSARYVRLEATSASGASFAVISEFDVGSATTIPVVGTSSGPGPATTYAAESAILAGGTFLESINGGFNGSGYVNFPTTDGTLTFNNVNGGTGGAKTLHIRFALGATGSRAGQVIVNGIPLSVTFPSTSLWTTWNTLDLPISLNNGSANTIQLKSTGNDLGNIDEIAVQ